MTALSDAYEQLEQAIRAVAHHEQYEGLVTDWVVITAVQTHDPNGNDLTAVGRLTPPGRLPYYRLLGLIEYAAAELRNGVDE